VKNKRQTKDNTIKVESNVNQLNLQTKVCLSKLVGSWLAIQNKETPMNK